MKTEWDQQSWLGNLPFPIEYFLLLITTWTLLSQAISVTP